MPDDFIPTLDGVGRHGGARIATPQPRVHDHRMVCLSPWAIVAMAASETSLSWFDFGEILPVIFLTVIVASAGIRQRWWCGLTVAAGGHAFVPTAAAAVVPPNLDSQITLVELSGVHGALLERSGFDRLLVAFIRGERVDAGRSALFGIIQRLAAGRQAPALAVNPCLARGRRTRCRSRGARVPGGRTLARPHEPCR